MSCRFWSRAANPLQYVDLGCQVLTTSLLRCIAVSDLPLLSEPQSPLIHFTLLRMDSSHRKVWWRSSSWSKSVQLSSLPGEVTALLVTSCPTGLASCSEDADLLQILLLSAALQNPTFRFPMLISASLLAVNHASAEGEKKEKICWESGEDLWSYWPPHQLAALNRRTWGFINLIKWLFVHVSCFVSTQISTP